MINVVGAGEDPENLTPATLYNFTPAQKKAPVPVKPTEPPQVGPVVAPPVTAPIAPPPPESINVAELTPPEVTPESTSDTFVPPQSTKPPQKNLKTLLIAGGVGLLLLTGGTGAALYLGQTNQDVRQQASTAIEETLEPTAELEPTLEPTSVPEPTLEPTSEPNLADDVELLALAPTLTPTPIPSPTPVMIDTTEHCDQSCATDENCQNPSHSCVSGSCRLSSNPSNASCKTPSGSSQITWDETQPPRTYSPYAELAGETPASGPADWLHYWWFGIGMLGLGATVLLFL